MQALALALVLAAAFALHGGVLRMGFGSDDGNNLYNALRLGAASYFLDPATLNVASAGSLAPWNLLVYGIGVTLFGLDPIGHHLQLLLVAAATAFATFRLLRLWTAVPAALAGALLLLAGAPMAFLSAQEMSGHYLYGLLFTALCVHCFVRCVRVPRWHTALGAAAFYLLASACKEVFVPLPVVLAFLPEGSWRSRWRAGWPLAAVVVFYVGWRWRVFEGSLLGPRGVPLDAAVAAAQVAGIPRLLFGLAWPVVAALAAWAGWRAQAGARERLRVLAFLLVLAACLVAPLLPVTPGIGLHAPDRLLALPYWVSCCALAVALGRGAGLRHRWVPALLLLALAAGQLALSLPWRAQIAATEKQWAQWYGFALSGNGPQSLLLRNDTGYFWQKFHIDGLRMAARYAGLPYNAQGRVVASAEDLAQAEAAGATSWLALDEATATLRAPRDAAEASAWTAGLPHKPPGVYVLRAMPAMRFASAGQVEPARAVGTRVTLRGVTPDAGLGHDFTVLAPRACAVQSLVRGPASAAGLAFDLALACADAEAAQAVAAGLCLVVGNGAAISVPAGHANPDCARLSAP